jgi:hypothetical protein
MVTIDKKLWFAVEAKSNDTNPSPHLYYFAEKLILPAKMDTQYMCSPRGVRCHVK